MEIRKSKVDGFVELTCDEAHVIRRNGSPDAGNRRAIVPEGADGEWEELSLAEVNAAKEAEARNAAYEADVERRIRERYTLSQELAILRQRDTKPDEFAEYNAYAERCKAESKAALADGKEE